MLNKLFLLAIFSITAISSSLSALNYEIHDIGTLQTHSSQAIALNNEGQILGWYNIDSTANGKHYFLRNQDGVFYEIPAKENGEGVEINWRYLTDDGKAYGTYDGNINFAVLYVWDQHNGLVKLGNLPGKEISAINKAGQVLIKSIVDAENGRTVIRPVIWQNGNFTKLKGVESPLGIESNESYGLSMNNRGEVIGYAATFLIYKNQSYKRYHAVKWVNGEVTDLHSLIPKSNESKAMGINDNGDIVIQGDICGSALLQNDGQLITPFYFKEGCKLTNTCNCSVDHYIYGKNGTIIISFGNFEDAINKNSIWSRVCKIIAINDSLEIIADGETIYGETHAMLLCPATTD